jgi:Spy/CpxP family protein refolding chaperone
MKKITTMFLVLSFLAFVQSSFAQRREGRMEGHQGGRQPFERLESFKKIRMMEALHLDENTSIKFFARYDKHEDRMRAIEAERNDVVEQLDSLSRDDAGDEAYKAVFDQFTAIDKEIARERSDFLASLKEVLTDKQIAQYIVFERNFMRDLRRIVREIQLDKMKGH